MNRYQDVHYGYPPQRLRTPIDINTYLHIINIEATGQDTNNESTYGSDTNIALEGPEAEGHPNEFIPSNQSKLTELMREINDLCQWVEAEIA